MIFHDRNVIRLQTLVEATTLSERCFTLKPQDEFLRDNIGKDDILLVSVGGNDIALRPSICTIASMAGLLCLPTTLVETGCSCWAPQVCIAYWKNYLFASKSNAGRMSYSTVSETKRLY